MRGPRFGPAHPRWGRLGARVSESTLRRWASIRRFHTPHSRLADETCRAVRQRLERGEPAYLLGLGAGGHDSGAALVEVSAEHGVRIVSSHAEERFTGIRHYAGFPVESLICIRRDLDRLGLRPIDLAACLTTFDYVRLFSREVQGFLEEFPGSLALAHADVYPDALGPAWSGFSAHRRLQNALGTPSIPVIGAPHHDGHAAFAWASSPFARESAPTLVAVVDAQGDESSVSFFVGQGDRLAPLYSNRSLWDSLGHYYAFVSSTYGGRPIGRAEGIWMAAAAFGDPEPSSNPFHPVLRRLLGWDDRGLPRIDRSLANWHVAGAREPFSADFRARLRQAAGDRLDGPIPAFSYDSKPPAHADLAAATQRVFEESMQRLLGHALRASGARQLVLTGGTALNCIANLAVTEAFDEDFFERELGRSGTKLRLWVPPAPADDGVPAGAAIRFALGSGAQVGPPLSHAFHCGEEPPDREILDALRISSRIGFEPLEDAGASRDRLADLLAEIISTGGVVGLYRGRAEIGPRALGHRSILADPRSARMRDFINRKVKEREPFRPLAPICSRQDADRWFELDSEAAGLDRSVYHWMALAARARPEARKALPAVIHRDGTARLQIVPEEDVLLGRLLQELGRRIGVEVAINTSLNLRGPIVQTPGQAVQLLDRSAGLDAILLIGDRTPYLAWSDRRGSLRAHRIQRWLAHWRSSLRSDRAPRQAGDPVETFEG